MSFQNPFNSIPVLNTVTLDVDNCEDDFEEFNEDNWLPSTMSNQQLWDENWDDTDNVDEDSFRSHKTKHFSKLIYVRVLFCFYEIITIPKWKLK
ncbi:hypothetical protein HUG17_7195 [Dermatophagoides farinae]|uniref:Uncharacterized protein n=1 Tax=Dermatophagoides farinae TaxID=6954 RepID=A0A9D4NRA3_DERFA|nr:hypothetical protein HUG17_7195 [Dermatophagoides farinae]